MDRRTVIAGNWKMYKTVEEAVSFVQQFAPQVQNLDRDLYLAVPFTAIQPCVQAAQGGSVAIGAQNMNDASEGAFTGEIAGAMLRDVGASFVLLGHSERRHVFKEDNAFINRKVKRALEDGIQPVLCVGEKLEEREAGQTEAVLQEQLAGSLAEVSGEELSKMVLAYEPVWAIGTGKTATPEIAQEAHDMIRRYVTEIWGAEVAQGLRVLYGGSVKPANAGELMAKRDIDGVLVGGASLEADSFAQIASASFEKEMPSPPARTIVEDVDDLSEMIAAEEDTVEGESPLESPEPFGLDEEELEAADAVGESFEDEEALASAEEEEQTLLEAERKAMEDTLVEDEEFLSDPDTIWEEEEAGLETQHPVEPETSSGSTESEETRS